MHLVQKKSIMKKLFTILMLLCLQNAYSQYTSPGNGTVFTLSSLSAAAPNAVVNNGTDFTMLQNVTISVGDTFLMDTNTTLKMNSNVQLTVAGTYTTTASQILITATDPNLPFRGILFDITSNVSIKNTTLEYGGGIRVSTSNFLMDNCIVRNFKSGLVTSGAMSFSTGTPVVQNSQFINNDLPALSSGANQTVALSSLNNYLSGNSKTNGNRPQINMGPSGNGTTKIINNTILGNTAYNKVGGIAVVTLLGDPNNVQIQGNTVKNNRYGITVSGNTSAGSISNNIIENNNAETNPMMGGSGIALTGSGSAVMNISIRNNQIRGNLWGVTLQGTSRANLGDDNLPGGNIFSNNGNGGNIYALFNNTPNAISAKGNCWRENEQSTPAMVEAVISHQVDDPALGLVSFEPFNCGVVLATAEIEKLDAKIYPNPSKEMFFVEVAKSGNYILKDASGRLVMSGILVKGKNQIDVNVSPGIYFIDIQQGEKRSTSKMIIE